MAVLSDAQKRDVRAMICDVLEIEPEELSETSHFVDDHGADSLRAIEILANLETSYGVAIDQAALKRMTTLDNVYAVLAEVSAGV